MNPLRQKYINKLLSKTITLEKVKLGEVIKCSECKRRLDHQEEYYILHKKMVCLKRCIKENGILYEGYIEEYPNDLFLIFYKVFSKDTMRTYDIVSCQILPVNHNGIIKYHVDIFYREKKDVVEEIQTIENLYKAFSKCPVKNCEKTISKDKFEVMFNSDNPEKIRKKKMLLKIMKATTSLNYKLGTRIKVGIPCCEHFDLVFKEKN